MIVGIMQPYFWPYAEHFRLMADCDRWIVFDTVAYRRKTWMSRNRVANRDREWTYISVPVTRGAHNGTVAGAVVAGVEWRGVVEDRLRPYAPHAPYYGETMEFVRRTHAVAHRTLAELNTGILRATANHLGIDTPIEPLSTMDLDLPAQAPPGEWAPLIAHALGATEYRNPSGGRHLFDERRFAELGVQLSFHDDEGLSYGTHPFETVPRLSVLDSLMWCGRHELGAWMNRSVGAHG